jgi:hypothetical protein
MDKKWMKISLMILFAAKMTITKVGDFWSTKDDYLNTSGNHLQPVRMCQFYDKPDRS